MIPVAEVYLDCADDINIQENGAFNYDMFNRFSWRGQLRLMDWLSGDVSGVIPPEPYRTQKNRDWLSDFVVSYKANVVDGIITRPQDYYLYQDLFVLKGNLTDCDDDEKIIEDDPVTLLSNDKFKVRAKTNIKRLKPSHGKPIVKQVGRTFEWKPIDIGSVKLEYIRYPAKAIIVTKLDTTYNEEVPDEDASTDFEWNENARGILCWFIVDSFNNRTREQGSKQMQLQTGKTVRDAR